jgi:hypothetical protein
MADENSGDDKGMAAIGELICRLNPYTNQDWNELNQLKTGEMQVCMLPHAAGEPAVYGKLDAQYTIAQMSIEVERNYGTQWTFKGQTQHVRSAFRIPYRFPVQDQKGKTLYWQTEYLLIGYAGGDGGA